MPAKPDRPRSIPVTLTHSAARSPTRSGPTLVPLAVSAARSPTRSGPQLWYRWRSPPHDRQPDQGPTLVRLAVSAAGAPLTPLKAPRSARHPLPPIGDGAVA